MDLFMYIYIYIYIYQGREEDQAAGPPLLQGPHLRLQAQQVQLSNKVYKK